jgi:hypothetical protein
MARSSAIDILERGVIRGLGGWEGCVADISWKSLGPPEADREYLVMASALPLMNRWRVPQFLSLTRVVQQQLATSVGLKGYALRAHVWSGNFWTLSAWDDEESLSGFARALPHRDVMRTLRPHMGKTEFVTWWESGAALPLSLDVGLARLASATV